MVHRGARRGSALSVGGFCVREGLGIGTSWSWHPQVLCEPALCLMLPYIPLSAPGKRLHMEEAFCQMHRVASVAWLSRPAVLSERGRFTDCIVVYRAG